MNANLIYNTIGEISLYLDPTTLQEIKIFMETFLGETWQTNPKLHIYACTAIVCECKKIPAVLSRAHVPFGFSVEKMMRYYSDAPKEEFINTIISLAQKWPTCPPLFRHKLQNLKLSFRVFKKYRHSCKNIGEKLQIDQSNNFLLSSLFWLVYLFAKLHFGQSDSLEIMTIIVPSLIQEMYATCFQLSSRQVVKEIISKFFPSTNALNECMRETQSKYQREFHKILNESYNRRYLIEISNFSLLIQKPSVLQRLIDDLSNSFSKAFQNFPQFSLDQMSFLQLDKDMTPEAFHQKIDRDRFIINQRISFENERNYGGQLVTPKRAVARRNQIIQQTPLTIRMQNMAWIRNCIQNLEQKVFETVQKFYTKYNKGNFNSFHILLLEKIQKAIQQFSPMCKDVSKRKQQIYKFFIYCLSIALEMYKQDIKVIIQTDSALFSLLCLCTEIFNFVYQAFSGDYTKYCQIFQVDYINAFCPINWLGYYFQLPKAVKQHLYQLERRFLLKQIWKTELGFKIITNHEQVVLISEQRMLKRLKFHINCRIQQICKETVGQKLVKKIYNMVIDLLQKKPMLLQKNNIDQIIICSITACLSINQDSNKLSLQKIFSFYSKASLSSQQDKQKLYDKDQNQLNIIDFYNNVFLQQIQQIISAHPQTSTFLLTPKRLQMTEKYKQGVEMTPLKLKYKENQSAFLKKKTQKSDEIPRYQLKYVLQQFSLARNIKMERESQMLDQSQQSLVENQKKSNLFQ